MRWALSIGACVLAILAVYALRSVLTPFAVAFALAYFLNPVVNALERLFQRLLGKAGRWLEPRTAAIGLMTGLLLIVIVLVVVLIVPVVTHQVSSTAERLPEYARSLRTKVEPHIQRFNLQYPEIFEEIRMRLEEAIRANLPDILRPISILAQTAFSSLLSLLLTVLNLLVIPVLAVYLLYDMNQIQAGLKDMVPMRYRSYVFSRMAEVDRLLSAFVRGQVTVCLILGSFYAIALTICGVPMGLVVGLTVGFFNMVPYMSTAVGLPLTLLLSWLSDSSWQTLIVVTCIFFFGQVVEGNFVTPRIVGQNLNLHAVVIMLAVLVGGTFFGFVGMFVAVPLTAALSVFWADLRKLYLGSAFYRGAEGAESPKP